jgi:hypothetical protein
MKQELSLVAIDLAKKIFPLVGADTTGKMAQTQHLNHEPPTAWNTLSSNEL